MSLPRRQHVAPTLSVQEPAVLHEGPANDPAPVVAALDDWRRTVEVLLKATAWHRDGENAARHTEIRRRMRALASAARSFGRDS